MNDDVSKILELYDQLGGPPEFQDRVAKDAADALAFRGRGGGSGSCAGCAFVGAPASFIRCDSCVETTNGLRSQWTSPHTLNQPNIKPKPLTIAVGLEPAPAPEPEELPSVPVFDPDVFLHVFPTSLGAVAAFKASDELEKLQRAYEEAVRQANIDSGYIGGNIPPSILSGPAGSTPRPSHPLHGQGQFIPRAPSPFDTFVAQKMDEELAKREPEPDAPDTPVVPDFDPDVFLMSTPRRFEQKEKASRLAAFAHRNNPNPKPKEEPVVGWGVEWGKSLSDDQIAEMKRVAMEELKMVQDFILAQFVQQAAAALKPEPEPEDIPDTPVVPAFDDEVLL